MKALSEEIMKFPPINYIAKGILDGVGGKKPVCVEACTMRALDAGPLEELESKYDVTKEVKGFNLFKGTMPSIRFKAKE